MELLYGGQRAESATRADAHRIALELRCLGSEEAAGPRHDHSSQVRKECSRRRPQVFASGVASCFAMFLWKELCAYAFPPKQYQASRQQGIREPCEVAWRRRGRRKREEEARAPREQGRRAILGRPTSRGQDKGLG